MALRLLRRRPLATSTVATMSLLTGYAVATEREADRREAASSSEHQLPRTYQWEAIQAYWTSRPVSTLHRLATIVVELGPVALAYTHDFWWKSLPSDVSTQNMLRQRHAAALRQALTNLGPAFVKAGQQLSIRPDLVPPAVLKELQKLCDAVRPIPNHIAMEVVRQELQMEDLDEIYTDMRLVASASLGQVYKATLRSNGEAVALKVQRPQTRRTFSLDLFLLQNVGVVVDAFTSTFTNQPPFHRELYESFASGSYAELDYVQEAANQTMFRRELAARRCEVVIPMVYAEYTTERILTSQWIDGEKLADSPQEKIRELIPVGVELFLTQLLDIGVFHADPHPGNLLVDRTGKLCLLDFGLCAQVDQKSRDAITKAIVHLLMRDFDALVKEDAIELGFLPENFDGSELKPILTKILTVAVVDSGGSDLRKRKKKLMEISNELNEVFFKYPFSVPPFFALVTRGLGLLEGIALSGDPEFDIFQASVPYARRRAVAILGAHSLRHLTSKKATTWGA